jgi:hypothetical protein
MSDLQFEEGESYNTGGLTTMPIMKKVSFGEKILRKLGFKKNSSRSKYILIGIALLFLIASFIIFRRSLPSPGPIQFSDNIPPAIKAALLKGQK